MRTSLPSAASASAVVGLSVQAMSEENVEIVRRLYSDPRDFMLAAVDHAAEDVLIDLSSLYPDRPMMSGLDAARRFRQEAPWAEIEFDPESFLAVGDDRVLVLVRATGTGRQSGAQVNTAVAHEFTFRNRRIVRFKVYADQGQALAASGLDLPGEPG